MSDQITIVGKPEFVLDDRSVVRLLEELDTYCRDMPAVQFDQPDSGDWAQVLLGGKEKTGPQGLTRAQRLAQWAANPQALEGGQRRATQIFVLAMLRLLETPRQLLNQLPARYRDLYYRDMLGLGERAAQADRVTLALTLEDTCAELALPAGMVFDGGQDSTGTALRYALDSTYVANHARWTDLRWVVAGRSRVVLDEGAKQPWPAGGVRLFEPAAPAPGAVPAPGQDRTVRTGRVVGSPLLAATGGRRTWVLTCASEIDTPDSITAEISIGDQWVKLKSGPKGGSKMLQYVLDAQAGAPTPVVALDGLSAATPLLRLTREDGKAVPAVTDLVLGVEGATGVKLATPDGVAAAAQPCYPFGGVPQVGAALNMMAADWLTMGSRLTAVILTPAWVGLPTMSMEKWYDKYRDATSQPWPTKDSGNAAFRVMPGVMSQDGTQSPAKSDVPLFSDGAAGAPSGCQLIVRPGSGFPSLTPVAPPDSDNPVEWPWWIRLTLTESFGHAFYQAHLAAPLELKPVNVTEDGTPSGKVLHYPVAKDGKVAESTQAITTLQATPKEEWRAPYTPQWQSVKIDYTAAASVTDKGVVQAVLTPFGYASADETPPPAAVADLYVGVQAIAPGQLLGLHWQLRSPQGQTIGWEYLGAGGYWRRMDDAVIDGTAHWQTSGLWSLMWPQDALDTANVSPMLRCMPPGRYWLRARVKVPSRNMYTLVGKVPRSGESQAFMTMPVYPWLVGIDTNAVSATLVDPQTVEAAHFAQPLPAQSVTQALAPPQGLLAVTQPWPSTGGQPAEAREAFLARTARRLRHRERALNDDDLLTLLHEQYPVLSEVQMAQTRVERSIRHQSEQTIVVMPTQAGRDNDEALYPAFSPTHLDEMRDWLTQRASPWLGLTLRNPDYVLVPVRWEVVFRAGVSVAYGNQQIRQALTQRYLPWVSGAISTRVIGQALDYYQMLRVIRECEAVQQVTDLKLDGQEYACRAGGTEVLVPVFAAAEYDGFALAFIDPAPDTREGAAAGAAYGRAAVYGNGVNQVAVTLQVPPKIGASTITPDQVFLYDCDTGERLADSSEYGGLASIAKKGSYCQALRYEHDVVLPKAQENGDITPLVKTLYVSANDVVGSYRIGIGVDTTDANGQALTLRSGEAGQTLTLEVVRGISYSNADVWTVSTLPAVALSVSREVEKTVHATLETYLAKVRPDWNAPATLEWTAHGGDHQYTPEEVTDSTHGIVPVKPFYVDQQKAHVEPSDVDPAVKYVKGFGDHLRLWWIDPVAQVKPKDIPTGMPVFYGFRENSKAGASSAVSLGNLSVTFNPAPRILAAPVCPVYALRIQADGSKIGEDCKPAGSVIRGIDVSDAYGNKGTLWLQLSLDGAPVPASKFE
ncbi:baseplate J/gp47 family protein [Paraburkholderia aspalathi]|uniref:hypothetical protein n=1 Tax=Paraburkholderia aspalathi TaxID=1324617 RepID=UPI0038B6D30E